MTLEKVISRGLGEVAGPHGSPAAQTPGNTVVSVDVDLPARRGERRFRTEFFELTPAQYKRWNDSWETARYAAELGLDEGDY